MIPLSVPNLKGNEKKYLNRCISTEFVSSVGEYVNILKKISLNLPDQNMQLLVLVAQQLFI